MDEDDSDDDSDDDEEEDEDEEEEAGYDMVAPEVITELICPACTYANPLDTPNRQCEICEGPLPPPPAPVQVPRPRTRAPVVKKQKEKKEKKEKTKKEKARPINTPASNTHHVISALEQEEEVEEELEETSSPDSELNASTYAIQDAPADTIQETPSHPHQDIVYSASQGIPSNTVQDTSSPSIDSLMPSQSMQDTPSVSIQDPSSHPVSTKEANTAAMIVTAVAAESDESLVAPRVESTNENATPVPALVPAPAIVATVAPAVSGAGPPMSVVHHHGPFIPLGPFVQPRHLGAATTTTTRHLGAATTTTTTTNKDIGKGRAHDRGNDRGKGKGRDSDSDSDDRAPVSALGHGTTSAEGVDEGPAGPTGRISFSR